VSLHLQCFTTADYRTSCASLSHRLHSVDTEPEGSRETGERADGSYGSGGETQEDGGENGEEVDGTISSFCRFGVVGEGHWRLKAFSNLPVLKPQSRSTKKHELIPHYPTSRAAWKEHKTTLAEPS
jgi:hypothetical protein